MRSMSALGPWKKYKRYSDNVKLEARLILDGDQKLMEIREKRGDQINCPNCSVTLSIKGGHNMPHFLLEPAVFHERHRPLDKA